MQSTSPRRRILHELSLSPKAETTRQLSPRAACKLRHTKLAHRLIRGISYSAPVRSVRWNGNRVPARPQTTWFAFFEAQVTTGCCSGWSHPGSVEHEASRLPTLIQTGRLLTSGSCLQFSAPRTPPLRGCSCHPSDSKSQSHRS